MKKRGLEKEKSFWWYVIVIVIVIILLMFLFLIVSNFKKIYTGRVTEGYVGDTGDEVVSMEDSDVIITSPSEDATTESSSVKGSNQQEQKSSLAEGADSFKKEQSPAEKGSSKQKSSPEGWAASKKPENIFTKAFSYLRGLFSGEPTSESTEIVSSESGESEGAFAQMISFLKSIFA